MRHCHALVTLAAILVLCFSPSDSTAQFFAAEQYPGYIYSYDDTVGTVVNPDTLLPAIAGVSLDHQGRLLLASQDGVTDVIRFDADTQTVELLDPYVSGSLTTEVCQDLGDDIYVLKESNWKGDGARQYESWIGILHGGMGPAVPAYVFGSDAGLLDAQVWPFGERAGNLLVLTSADGRSLIEFTRAPDDSLEFVCEIVDSGMMPSGAMGFAISPDGIIIIVDYAYGLYYVDEEYNYVWGFGDAYGVGYTDIEIDANGIIYLANTGTDRIERYGSDGYQIGSAFGSDLVSLGAVGATGFTPTPEGEDVLVEPGENIEVTYEEVTSSGFTIAEVTVTTDRISPELNLLPAYADLPGTRADDFSYILLATDAVYEGLIQVDVLEEGSRLFYASGTSDTFRDFTVVGSIEDARGTIPRFSELPGAGGKRVEAGPTEVVLVEDSRTLSEVTIYKFWRLELAMDVPDNMPGGDPCPWEYIEWLQKYYESARDYYDVGQYTNALSELAVMNGLIRINAGSCIPDSSDDPFGNLVAHILAHSKTLMYTIALESGEAFTGIDTLTSIALSVTNPARGECKLALSGPVGTEVAAHIYSVAGRLVATVFEGKLPEGGETVVWDGLDHAGQPIASGVYFARLESSEEIQTAKLVYIR
ncbi:hypothetical protein KAW64_07485 [bacterium]|nr:hypothetical protein [bacterium]